MKPNSNSSRGERPCFGPAQERNERRWASRCGGVAAPRGFERRRRGSAQPACDPRQSLRRLSGTHTTPLVALSSQRSLTQCRTLLSLCTEIELTSDRAWFPKSTWKAEAFLACCWSSPDPSSSLVSQIQFSFRLLTSSTAAKYRGVRKFHQK